jgi:hypothetical protein
MQAIDALEELEHKANIPLGPTITQVNLPIYTNPMAEVLLPTTYSICLWQAAATTTLMDPQFRI